MGEPVARVGIVMGSKSDWEIMSAARDILVEFGLAHEARVLSAHRTPEQTLEYASTAHERGLEVLIAGAGGAAHLAGVLASKTLLPVLGVPITSVLNGMDSLLSTVQMPRGIPVATFAIGKAGAANAALFAVSVLARGEPALADRLRAWRASRAAEVLAQTLP